MKEYEYFVELYATKSLRVKAESEEEADEKADLILSTETIPVKQDDIISIHISDTYECTGFEDTVTDWDKP